MVVFQLFRAPRASPSHYNSYFNRVQAALSFSIGNSSSFFASMCKAAMAIYTSTIYDDSTEFDNTILHDQTGGLWFFRRLSLHSIKMLTSIQTKTFMIQNRKLGTTLHSTRAKSASSWYCTHYNKKIFECFSRRVADDGYFTAVSSQMRNCKDIAIQYSTSG